MGIESAFAYCENRFHFCWCVSIARAHSIDFSFSGFFSHCKFTIWFDLISPKTVNLDRLGQRDGKIKTKKGEQTWIKIDIFIRAEPSTAIKSPFVSIMSCCDNGNEQQWRCRWYKRYSSLGNSDRMRKNTRRTTTNTVCALEILKSNRILSISPAMIQRFFVQPFNSFRTWIATIPSMSDSHYHFD